MRKIILTLILIVPFTFFNSCNEGEEITTSEMQLESKDGTFKLANSRNDLILDIKKTTGLDVQKLNSIEYTNDKDGGYFVNIKFTLYNNEEKNIIYTNSKLTLNLKNGFTYVKPEINLKIGHAPLAKKIWCADCSGCQAAFDLDANVAFCNQQCCNLYIQDVPDK